MSTLNPYSPPAAVVADHQPVPGRDRLVPYGRRRPLHHGWKWIAEGWQLYKRQPGMWILATILLYAALLLLSLIPFVNFVTTLIWPVLIAGLFVMAHMAHRGERFSLAHLFSGFSGRPGTLVLVGVTYLGLTLAIVAAFVAVGGSMWFDMAAGNPDPAAFAGTGAAIAVYVFVMMALSTIIAFAPPLVQLNGVSAFAAMKMSALGCFKNILPGTLFAVAFLLLMILSIVPLGLGLLITFPMIATTFYAAYRDIFMEPTRA